MNTLATHVLLECRGLNRELLSDPQALEAILRAGAEKAGAHVLGALLKRFEPQGASVVMMLAESHVSIHTWPEHDYAAVDVFTCGETLPEAGVEEIVRLMNPREHEVTRVERGPSLRPDKRREIGAFTVVPLEAA